MIRKPFFTFVEALVAIVVAVVLGVLIYNVASSVHSKDMDYSLINPQIESARSQRRIAEEMQRQNDLLQRRLELLEQKNLETEH